MSGLCMLPSPLRGSPLTASEYLTKYCISVQETLEQVQVEDQGAINHAAQGQRGRSAHGASEVNLFSHVGTRDESENKRWRGRKNVRTLVSM